MKHWSVRYHSEDLYGSVAELCVDERPVWAHYAGILAEKIDALFGHNWCNPPQGAWEFIIKKPTNEDATDEISLGALLYDSFNRVLGLEDKLAHDGHRIPVSRAWLRDNGMAEDVESFLKEAFDED